MHRQIADGPAGGPEQYAVVYPCGEDMYLDLQTGDTYMQVFLICVCVCVCVCV